ncbi:MAG: galactose-1-phosphate uridylyltransferase [Flavobacteriaceae bacterium]|nr:MAG: galactose-1-phosphate uridylyltransferase [Flavobacteriaceae bacterium]
MYATLNTAPHRRYNILTGEWILVSPHRNKRPWQGKKDVAAPAQTIAYDKDCFLCPDNLRANGSTNPNYKGVYSFVNDYAAINNHAEYKEYNDGLLTAETETGICKVICFSDDHSLTLPLMTASQITAVIQTWKSEYLQLGAKQDINYVQIFENKGAIMGCSNPHPHGQIWAHRSVPVEILKKNKMQQVFWEQNKKSLLSEYLEQELKCNKRIVLQNEHFVALVPFWAVWPYEIMILPKNHYQHIGQLSVDEEKTFAEIIKKVTIKYDNLFETSFPYSAGIHQCPTDGPAHPEWHFHMLFYPPLLRSSEVKKFMVGYEMFATPQRDITAESAANTLRNLKDIHFSL